MDVGRSSTPLCKVVTVIPGLSRGGAEEAVLRQVAATRNKVDHHVISLMEGGPLAAEIRALGVPVSEIGLKRNQMPGAASLSFLASIAREKPDIIVAHMYHGAVAAAFAKLARLQRTPLVWVIHHSLDDFSAEGSSTRRAVRLCRVLSSLPAQIIYVSERSARQHESFGFNAARTKTIPNGYDLEIFRFDGRGRERLRREWGFSEADFVVGHVARLHPMKDHPNLIAALELAIGREPRVAAVICGDGTDTLSLPHSIRSRVRLLGPRRDMSAVMSACDIGILSSSHGEAFPNVLSEFMACERPCVTTDVGDAAKIVQRYGAVVAPRSAADLAEGVLDLARLETEALRALGAAARKSILERVDIRNISMRHMEMWALLAGKEAACR